MRGVVRKTRRLYLVGQTRVHLDRVEDVDETVGRPVAAGTNRDVGGQGLGHS